MKRLLLAKLSLIAALIPAYCFSSESTPARFGSSSTEFIEKVQLPKLEDGAVRFTRCAAKVSDQGQFGLIVCYNNDGSHVRRSTIRSIQSAANSITITPATVDGEAVTVWFSFTLVYRQSGDVMHVQILENHLYNSEHLGVNYVSAQRYNFPNWRCRQTRHLPIFVTVTVSKFGEILEVESTKDPTSSKCAEAILQAVVNSKFIPAQIDEEKVTSIYLEAFYSTLR